MGPHSLGRARITLAIAVLVGAHALLRPVVRGAFGCGPVDGPDGVDAELVVLSWNLHNFPSADQDLDRIAARIEATLPHVLALQEIRDGEALAELVPTRTIRLSRHGGAHGQHLGVALDDRTVLLDEPVEHRALEIGGRVRPALSLRVHTDAGRDVQLVVVHLKATADGAALRRLQWAMLADAIARLRAGGDPDLLVVGDFNATGDDVRSADDERRELADVLARVGLRELPVEGGCSAYWDGERRDGWREPSLLDLVFVGGFADRPDDAWRVTPLGACAAHGCNALRSTAAHPDPELAGTSDHCGVLVQLAR